MSGYTVVDPPSVVATHLTELLKKHAAELLGREETKQLVDHLKESHPILVDEVTPQLLSIGELQKVFVQLLKEKVSIRNLPLIFETLADYAAVTKDSELLAEYVRQSLSRQITEQVMQGEILHVVTVSSEMELDIQSAIQKTEFGNYLALDPEKATRFIETLQERATEFERYGAHPIILTSPSIRMFVRQLTERYFPDIPILSYNELMPTIEVKSIGVI